VTKPLFLASLLSVLLPLANLSGEVSDITSFQVPGDEGVARFLNEHTREHFEKRPINRPATFHLPYLAISDSWLNASRRDDGRAIQQHLREWLLTTKLSPEGFVHTHQHLSDAWDWGWPFPFWNQVTSGGSRMWGYYFWEKSPKYRPGLFHFYPMLFEKFGGEAAMAQWKFDGMAPTARSGKTWKEFQISGKGATLTGPGTGVLLAKGAPLLQVRWKFEGLPTKAPFEARIEWRRVGEETFSPDRSLAFLVSPEDLSGDTGMIHTTIPVHQHPLWTDEVREIRITLPPQTQGALVRMDSIFPSVDTRHQVNNALFISAAWDYFRWTGDTDFLKKILPRCELALQFQMKELGAEKLHLIHVPWPGHSGISGIGRSAKGEVTVNPGQGLGGNYWDLLPFGGDDFFATLHYYQSLLAVAGLREAAGPDGGLTPAELRKEAAAVAEVANRVFWSSETGRFVACVAADGTRPDFGYSIPNLEAIANGMASQPHAVSIFDWLDGRRLVGSDTSQGADVYRWRFGPRASTKRNTEWYKCSWIHSETIKWGGQVQDGGAVLGFSYYDLLARLRILGPTDAWKRLQAISDWHREVMNAGGYRKYYADPARGNTLQGSNTAGGIGIDAEFFESSMLPAAVLSGWMGLAPDGKQLFISPKLPEGIDSLGVKNLRVLGSLCQVTVSGKTVEITAAEGSSVPPVVLPPGWKITKSADNKSLTGILP